MRNAVGPLGHFRTTAYLNTRTQWETQKWRSQSYIELDWKEQQVKPKFPHVVSKCKSSCHQKGPYEYWRPSKLWPPRLYKKGFIWEMSLLQSFFFFLMLGILIDAPAVNLCNDLWYGGHLPSREAWWAHLQAVHYFIEIAHRLEISRVGVVES